MGVNDAGILGVAIGSGERLGRIAVGDAICFSSRSSSETELERTDVGVVVFDSATSRGKRLTGSSAVIANKESPGDIASYLNIDGCWLRVLVGSTVHLSEYLSSAMSSAEWPLLESQDLVISKTMLTFPMELLVTPL